MASAEQLAPDEAEVDELQRAALDGLRFPNYVRHLQIEDRRSGQLVPLELNPVQRKLRERIEARLRAREPVRMIVLKSRRMGVSTLIQATFAHLAFTTMRFTAQTGAHEHVASAYLHGMTEQMYRGLPAGLQVPKETGRQGKVLELTNGSSLSTFTAKSREGVGRSMAARAVHASEVAYWDDASTTMGGLRQIVPDEPGTFVIMESTANGVGDFFHREWQRAIAGESGYEPVFFAWFEFPDYRRPVPEGGLGELDADERALVETFAVDEEQLSWRRHAIESQCGGSLDTFHEEYPSTPDEAWLSSGRPYFTKLGAIPHRPAVRVGEISGAPIRGGNVRFDSRDDGRFRIWERPRASSDGRVRDRYVIGADVAGSVILADHDARPVGAKSDAYCAYVVDIDTAKTVASFHARGITEKEYARELAALGRLYMDAEIAVEKAGGYGTMTIIELRDSFAYPRIHEHLDDDSTQRWDGTGQLGFPMTTVTRPLVLAALDSLQRDAPETIVDPDLVAEMRTFVTNRAGKPEADTGCHDDRVMARAIAAHIRNLRALRVTRVPRPDVSPRKPHPTRPNFQDRHRSVRAGNLR